MSTPNPSPDENIIFKSDQHAANISEKLLKFYEKSEFFDTVLVAGSGCINIHANRNILAAMSNFFLDIFRGNHTASKGNQVELKDIDATALKLIVDFMYSGLIALNLKNAESILRTAVTLKMKILVDGCCEFIVKHIDTSNCLMWFLLSKELSLSELKDKSLKYTYNHIDEISKKNEFLKLNEAELKDLLFNENPDGDFEENVFRSMIAWIEYDKVNREHLLCRFLSMVRYQFLTPKFINENRKSVCTTLENSELVFRWLQWHLSSETRLVTDHQTCASKPKQVEGKFAVIYTTSLHEILIQTYNRDLNSWSIEKQTRIWKRKSNNSLIILGNKLMVGGHTERNGITVECLDLHTFMWNDLPPMQNKRGQCKLANLNGNLLVSGINDGHIEYGKCNILNDSIEIYNFSKREWQVKMMAEKSLHTKIYTHNGLFYIFDFHLKCLDSYYISTNQWTSKTIKTELPNNYGFVGFGGFVYFIGGYYNNRMCNSVKRYDLSEDTWCEVAPLPQARSGVITTIFENKILISGGEPDGKLVDEYNPDTDTWITLSPFSVEPSCTNMCTYFYD